MRALMKGTWSLAKGFSELWTGSIREICDERLWDGRPFEQDRRRARIHRRDHVHVDDGANTGALTSRQSCNILRASVKALLFAAEQDEPQVVACLVCRQYARDLE
jgi:hypothetical protein